MRESIVDTLNHKCKQDLFFLNARSSIFTCSWKRARLKFHRPCFDRGERRSAQKGSIIQLPIPSQRRAPCQKPNKYNHYLQSTSCSLWSHGKAPLELLVQLRTDLVAAIALYFPQNAFLCIMIQKWLACLLELL